MKSQERKDACSTAGKMIIIEPSDICTVICCNFFESVEKLGKNAVCKYVLIYPIANQIISKAYARQNKRNILIHSSRNKD